MAGDVGAGLLEPSVGLDVGTNSSLGMMSGEGGFEVAVGEGWGWDGLGGGRRGGEDGLSMDLSLIWGGREGLFY